MQLQRFVTDVFEELGGVVVPVEYALCHVLIPEAYTGYFQQQSELELSFDYEVAQENPNSEFVTFGSYVLEQVLSIVQKEAKSTLRFAEVDRLQLGNPIKKLTGFLSNEPGKLEIITEKRVQGAWAVFQYHITYVSDEKVKTLEQVWVNLLTNKISSTLKQEQNRIIYQDKPIYSYPFPGSIDMNAALETATNEVVRMTEQRKDEQSNERFLSKDIERITNYYTELLAENERRLNRKGLTEKKKQEIAGKSEAIQLEKDKQLQEIHDKYTGQIEINLDQGMLYFIPLLEFVVEIKFRSDAKRRIVYYNPITKGFFQK